jgi:quinohemoprotein ethanol dehydrogenase
MQIARIGLRASACTLLLLSACQTGPRTSMQTTPVDAARLLAADSEPGQWMMDGRNYQAQRYSPLRQINEANVKDLGLAWYQELDTFRGVEGTPLYVDGVLYNISAWNITSAYNARTGRRLWTFDPQVPRDHCHT